MATMKHPNIVEFVGICELSNSAEPVIVMELMNTNLHDFLEHSHNLPLAMKQSILSDVANGLCFLHSQTPQIVHRDLTAANVLLQYTPSLELIAKVSDFGNSRLLPKCNVDKLTRNPGTLVYMPPEANDNYGVELDIFSFGQLTLFVLTQVCPSIAIDKLYNIDCLKTRLAIRVFNIYNIMCRVPEEYSMRPSLYSRTNQIRTKLVT